MSSESDKELLIKIATGQDWLIKQFNEFKDKVENHGDEIKDIKSDLRYLRDATSNNTKDISNNAKDIKVLQDERTVNVMEMGKKEVPKIFKLGIIAFIVTSLLTTLSIYFTYQDMIKKVINTQSNQNTQVQTQQINKSNGGNP